MKLLCQLMIFSAAFFFYRAEAIAQPAPGDPNFAAYVALKDRVEKATYNLSKRTENSALIFLCTIWALERDEERQVYRFFSKAHCVATDVVKRDLVCVASRRFYIHNDSAQVLRYIPVRVVDVGSQTRGHDVALFEASFEDMGDDQPLPLPLAKSSTTVVSGDRVLTFANPVGYAMRFFYGYISRKDVPEPLRDPNAQINWERIMIVEMGGGRGASGAAIVSIDQQAVIGTYMGIIPGSPTAFVLHVDVLHEFLKRVDEGKHYPWFDPERSFNPSCLVE
jgi:hypothetical protein